MKETLTARCIDRSMVSFGMLFRRHSSRVARRIALYCGSMTLPFSRRDHRYGRVLSGSCETHTYVEWRRRFYSRACRSRDLSAGRWPISSWQCFANARGQRDVECRLSRGERRVQAPFDSSSNVHLSESTVSSDREVRKLNRDDNRPYRTRFATLMLI